MPFAITRSAVRCLLALAIACSAARPTAHAAPSLAAAPSPSARQGHSLVAIGGDAYLFGGAAAGGVQNDLWLWHSGGWSALPIASRPPARTQHAAAVVANVMYTFFGQNSAGEGLADVWAYNPYSRQWSRRPSLGAAPAARFGHSALAVGGDILVFGGQTAGGEFDSCVYRYQPPSGLWTKGACVAAQQPFIGHSAAIVNGDMLVYPGDASLDRLLRYSLGDDAWSTMAVADPGYAPRAGAAAAGRDGRLWLFGGSIAGSGETINVLEISAPPGAAPASLRPLPCLTTARSGAQAAIVALAANSSVSLTTALIFGGVHNGQAISETVVYWIGPPLPTATPTVAVTPSPTPTITRTPTAGPTAIVAYGYRITLPVVLGH
jgi:hypothetical protein